MQLNYSLGGITISRLQYGHPATIHFITMAKRIELFDNGVKFLEEPHEYWYGDIQLSGITSAITHQLQSARDEYNSIPEHMRERLIAQAGAYGSGLHQDINALLTRFEHSGTQEVEDFRTLTKGWNIEASEYCVSDLEHWASNIDLVVRVSDIEFELWDFKSYSNKLEFMSNAYNAYGVTTHTPKSEQVLIIDAALDAAMDVDVLASAFNMDKAQFMGQRVLIDNFGSLTGACAALVDKDWFMVFDNLTNFTENYNGEGMYWNYFYHVWKTFSVSPFANNALFIPGTPTVTGVTVNPTTATIAKGHSMQITANVATTNFAPKSVNWTSANNTVTVDAAGIVTVLDTATTGGKVKIRATSTFDSTKYAECEVTIG